MDTGHQSFSWLNPLLIIATVITLVLVMAAVYKGWKKDEGFSHSEKGSPGIIADITVNLGGIPFREHCLTCHPQGGFAKPGSSETFREHPPISPHSISNLGCTGCHWGEGMPGTWSYPTDSKRTGLEECSRERICKPVAIAAMNCGP